MAITEILPEKAVKITRNFLVTYYRDGRKISYYFNPSTRETSYKGERGQIIIQWMKDFAIETVNGVRYRWDGGDYRVLYNYYYPLPSELQKAMVCAYLQEDAQETADSYRYKVEFLEGLYRYLEPSISLLAVSIAYKCGDEESLYQAGINMEMAKILDSLAHIASLNAVHLAGFEKPTRRPGLINVRRPGDALKPRIKALRSDGYTEVADILENSVSQLIHQAQVEAAMAIMKVLLKEDGSDCKSEQHTIVFGAFSRYMASKQEYGKVFMDAGVALRDME